MFRQYITDVLRREDMPEAVEKITAAYVRQVSEAEVRLRRLGQEAACLSDDARQRHHLLMHAVQVAAREAELNAEMAGALRHYQRVVTRIQVMTARCEGGVLRAEDVRAVLDEDVPPLPVRSVVLGFAPDGRFRSGRFVSADRRIAMYYPFVGYSMVLKAPGADSVIEPTFLVQDRALPASAIESEKALRLEALFPVVPATPQHRPPNARGAF